jgi:hypothetical protein
MAHNIGKKLKAAGFDADEIMEIIDNIMGSKKDVEVHPDVLEGDSNGILQEKKIYKEKIIPRP